MAKDPFSKDDVGTRGWRNEDPGVVEHEGIIFFLHCLPPWRITKSNEIVVRDGRGGSGGEVKPIRKWW